MAESTTRPLSKSEKAAIMMLCMDEETTAQLFDQMGDDEIKKVGSALIKLNQLPVAQIKDVIDEFNKSLGKTKEQDSTSINFDGNKVAENFFSRSLPKGRGKQILSSLNNPVPSLALPDQNATDLKGLVQNLEADTLLEIMGNEHPQVIAVILAYVKKNQAKLFLEKLISEVQVEVISRMARLQNISQEMMDHLVTFVSQKIKSLKSGGGSKKETSKKDIAVPVEGLESTVTLLKVFKRDQSDQILDQVSQLDAEMVEAIQKQMFTMEDMERSNDPGIRELLKSVSNEDLKVALKNCPDTLKERFFKNMSERAATILREDMEIMGPLKVEEIDTAQQNILKTAKELIKQEKMILTEVVSEEGE